MPIATVAGDFRLEFDGARTGYVLSDAAPERIQVSLAALPNVGDVAVTRSGPDVNGCYAWDVTFVSDLGPRPLLAADDRDLRGTVASMAVSRTTAGRLPPSAVVVPDAAPEQPSLLIPGLKQGIPYYVRE